MLGEHHRVTTIGRNSIYKLNVIYGAIGVCQDAHRSDSWRSELYLEAGMETG